MRASGWVLFSLVIAAVVKATAAVHLGGHPLLQPSAGLDTGAYADLARMVVSGNLSLGPGLYYVSPLYVYFLAAIYGLTASFEAVRLVQAVLGVVTVWLVYVMARDWAGTRAGVIAAVATAGSGVMTFYEVILMQSSLDGVLTACALAALTRGLLGRRGQTWFVLAGVAFGLLVLNRPNALAPAVVVAGALLVNRQRRRAAALAVGVALALSPVVVRNLVVSGQWALVSSQGGLNFYIGNSPEATGLYQPVPGVRPEVEGQRVDTRRVAEQAVGRSLTDAEVSDYFFDLGWSWVRSQPMAAARLFLYKFVLVLHSDHSALPYSYEFFVTDQPTLLRFLVLNPWLVMPFGLVGLVVGAWRRSAEDVVRHRAFLIWASFVPAYAASVAVFFVAERYRVPLFVPLAVTAGLVVDRLLTELWEHQPDAGRRYAARALALLVVAAVVVNWPAPIADGRAGERLRMATLSAAEGRFDEAADWVNRAAEVAPDRGRVYKVAGRAFLSGGALSQAEEHLRRARELGAADLDVLLDLADVDARLGRRADAQRTLQSIEWTQVADVASLLRAGRIASMSEATALAITLFERAVMRSPDSAEGWAQLGLTRLVARQWDDADAALQRAVALSPRDATVTAGLGWVALSRGDRAQAETHARAALALDPDDQLARQLIGQLGGASDSENGHPALSTEH